MHQEAVYQDYKDYDWDQFEEFQQGLTEILDNYLQNLQEQDPSITAIPALDKQQLINQAKCFFYCTKTGNILNLDDYETWERSHKIVELNDDDDITDDAPPYSSNYQELVELIVAGKPVPGIKDIPDTVLSGQSSTSTAKPRTKPWEQVEDTTQGK